MSIKHHLTACALGVSAVLSAVSLPLPVQAVELVRWERIPLPVSLHVGEERIVFVEKNVRVGVPPSLNEKLRIQSTGGAVYWRAESAFPQTRLQLQDVESGEILLLDVTATAGKGALEPVRVVYSGEVSTQRDSQTVRRSGQSGGNAGNTVPPAAGTGERTAKPRYPAPLPVLLTRYAAQNLYAPLRTVEPVPGVQSLSLTLPKTLTALYPSAPLTAQPLAGWQAAEYRVVAVKLTNQSARKVVLDPRQLQGQFVSATFQHQWLDAKGTPEDTTTVYLVMKGKPDKAFPAEPTVRRTGGKAR